jgi:hypothetical protein
MTAPVILVPPEPPTDFRVRLKVFDCAKELQLALYGGQKGRQEGQIKTARSEGITPCRIAGK